MRTPTPGNPLLRGTQRRGVGLERGGSQRSVIPCAYRRRDVEIGAGINGLFAAAATAPFVRLPFADADRRPGGVSHLAFGFRSAPLDTVVASTGSRASS